MTALRALLRELTGLFVEDGALASAIVTVVVLAGISATFLPAFPAVTGAILLFGCVGVLSLNVMTARQP